MRGDVSCWRIIAGEEGSLGRCVFSLLWFYRRSGRFYVQAYSSSAAVSEPLLLSLCNEKWLKHTPGKSDSSLFLSFFLGVSRMAHSIVFVCLKETAPLTSFLDDNSHQQHLNIVSQNWGFNLWPPSIWIYGRQRMNPDDFADPLTFFHCPVRYPNMF